MPVESLDKNTKFVFRASELTKTGLSEKKKKVDFLNRIGRYTLKKF